MDEVGVVGQRQEYIKKTEGIPVQLQIRGINNIDIWSQLYVLYSINIIVELPIVISVFQCSDCALYIDILVHCLWLLTCIIGSESHGDESTGQ